MPPLRLGARNLLARTVVQKAAAERGGPFDGLLLRLQLVNSGFTAASFGQTTPDRPLHVQLHVTASTITKFVGDGPPTELRLGRNLQLIAVILRSLRDAQHLRLEVAGKGREFFLGIQPVLKAIRDHPHWAEIHLDVEFACPAVQREVLELVPEHAVRKVLGDVSMAALLLRRSRAAPLLESVVFTSRESKDFTYFQLLRVPARVIEFRENLDFDLWFLSKEKSLPANEHLEKVVLNAQLTSSDVYGDARQWARDNLGDYREAMRNLRAVNPQLRLVLRHFHVHKRSSGILLYVDEALEFVDRAIRNAFRVARLAPKVGLQLEQVEFAFSDLLPEVDERFALQRFGLTPLLEERQNADVGDAWVAGWRTTPGGTQVHLYLC
ncbi:hypothetical protein M3Y99_01639500 [Aphelenchoides fujianensis]|nr:hypothetical protein M3Y99_01639500 [Aphelenchoides fujianensis]